jgi:extracellular elastinolytic metalloproteinase
MHVPLVRNTRARRALGVGAGALLCLSMLPGAGAAAAPTKPTTKPGSAKETLSNYDSRSAGPARKVLEARSALTAANPSAGVKNLRQELGVQGIVDIDALTGTPRRVTRVDGFLTNASTAAPAKVAIDYVRAHTDAFGLTAGAVDSLTLRNSYQDVEGTTHLSFVQQVGGVSFFGNGLKAHVTADGRLVQVDGSPAGSLPARVAEPTLVATAARDKAVADTFGSSKATVAKSSTSGNKLTTFSDGDQAQLVLFQTLTGPRLGWQTITMKEGYLHVIDAQSGRTLFRQSLVANDSGLAWENYPGAAKGGQQKSVNLSVKDWLPNNSPRLAGNVAHVFLDLNDNDLADAGEEVAPSGSKQFNYPFTPFTGTSCLPQYVCSWDPNVPFSWQTNAKQNAVQMMFFLGTWHDHLEKAPIGFTRSAGNFEAVDGDAVSANALDGANTAGGLPDGNHIDNANMSTPPDGIAPRMQMYLFHQPGATFPDQDEFIAGNSGDEADIVYHEYTHGLSNRLVVDANGVSTLGSIQAGSMGEAWSDWYAWDFLINEGLEKDTNAPGDILVGKYVEHGGTIRSQPLDCPVGSTSANCPGSPGAGPGGFTYGDFGRVTGGPEVHADGEIWAETLWDLRTALGSKTTESLVTRAMELSPSNPSFLDERNSILTADMVVNNGKNQKKIWQVFANRGMGWFAGSVDGDDAAPVEDFSMPPAANTPRGSLTGHVTNSDTGSPVAGAVVAFGGHNSGFAGDYAATTDASGSYTITGIIPGTYPKVFSRGAGYDPVVRTISVAARVNTLNWSLRRDWAAAGGGGSIVDFTPPDYTDFGCGPAAMIDQSQGTGWGSDAPDNPFPDPQPKFVVIALPVAVNIAELQINPSNTCGDSGSASTGDYKVETSTDGNTWTLGNAGHFGIADRHANTVPLAAGSATGVKFIKYTMIGTQVGDLGGACPGPFSGCNFMDSTELAVYGTPA